MKRITCATILCVCWLFASSLATGQTVNFTASGIATGGIKLASGQLCALPVDASNHPFPNGALGGSAGGALTNAPVCVAVTAGAIPTLVLPDTALTTPTNLCLRITVTAANGLPIYSNPCVQPASSGQLWCSTSGGVTTCNFDHYVPSIAPMSLASSAIDTTARAVATAAGSSAAAAQSTANAALPASGCTNPSGTVACPGGVRSASVAPPTGAPTGTSTAPLFHSTFGEKNLKGYGAKGDARIMQGCSITLSSTTLSCGSAFTSADIGKSVAQRGAGATDAVFSAAYVSGGTPAGYGLVTLSGFNSSCSGVTGVMVINNGTPGNVYITSHGTGCASAPTTATCAVLFGGATCSGTVTLTSTLMAETLYTTVSSVSGSNAVLSNAALTTTIGSYWQQALVGTDDTAAVQTAANVCLAGAGTTISVPSGTYYISSQITLDNIQSCNIRGQGFAFQASDFVSPQFVLASRTGSLLHMFGVIGVKIDSIGLRYWDHTYNGNLIDIEGNTSNSINIHFDGDSVGGLCGTMMGVACGSGTQSGPAKALVYMHGVYDIYFSHDWFQTAQVAIQGPSDSVIQANSINIEHSLFNGGFLWNPVQVMGQLWTILANAFEPKDNNWLSNGGTTSYMACGGIAMVNPAGGAGTTVSVNMVAEYNTFQDSAAGRGVCIDEATSGDVYAPATNHNQLAYGYTGVRVNSYGNTYASEISVNTLDHLTDGYLDTSYGDPSTGYPRTTTNAGTYAGRKWGPNIYSGSTGLVSLIHGGDNSTAGGGYFETLNINGYVTMAMGDWRGYGVWQDFSDINQSTCANGRYGQFSIQKDDTTQAWSSNSSHPSTCGKAGSAYQWNDIPVTQYAPNVGLAGKTTAITTTNLQFGGAVLPAGLYRLDYYVAVTTAGAGGTTLTPTFSWTDASGVQTNSPGALAASSLTSYSGSVLVKTDGVHNLTYATAMSGSFTYTLDVQLTRYK